MKIEGRNHIVYEYKNAVVRKTMYGDVHEVTNRSGCEIVLLKHENCTNVMERKLLNALNGIEEWSGQPIRDILYAHGKLKGYVCIKEINPEPVGMFEPTRVPESINVPHPPTESDRISNPGNKPVASSSMLENRFVRIAYSIVIIVCCAVVSKQAIYVPILRSAYRANGETGSLLATFSLDGNLGILIGSVIALICAFRLFESSSVLYYVLIPIIAVSMTGITYLLIRFTISLISTAANLFLAILPELAVLVILIMVIKSLFGK